MSDELDSFDSDESHSQEQSCLTYRAPPFRLPVTLGNGTIPRFLPGSILNIKCDNLNNELILKDTNSNELLCGIKEEVCLRNQSGTFNELQKMENEPVLMPPPAVPLREHFPHPQMASPGLAPSLEDFHMEFTDEPVPGRMTAHFREDVGRVELDCEEFIRQELKKLNEAEFERQLGDLIQNGCDPEQIEELIKKHLECEDSKEAPQSISTSAQSSLRQDSATQLTELSEFPVDPESSLQLVQKAIQCRVRPCGDGDCGQGKLIYNFLNKCLDERKLDSSRFAQEFIKAAFRHSQDCAEWQCSMPWCNVFSMNRHVINSENITEDKAPFWLMLQIFRQKNIRGQCILEPNDPDHHRFINLSCDLSRPPIEGVDFSVRSVMSHRKAFVLLTTLPPSWCHLSKIPNWDEDTQPQLVSVLQKISVKANAFTAKHKWLYLQSSSDAICMELSCNCAVTLDAVIRDSVLPQDIIMNMVLPRLRSALEFLRSNQILYFNWLSESIMVSGPDFSELRLSDFRCAVDWSSHKDNEEWIAAMKSRIPPYVVPPEINSEDQMLFPFSDYWGLGCLTYEMYTGSLPHARLSHLPYEDILDQMQSEPIPDYECIIDGPLKSLLRTCFKLEPQTRIIQ